MTHPNFRRWAAALVIGLSMSCQANAQSTPVSIGDTEYGGVVGARRGRGRRMVSPKPRTCPPGSPASW